MSQNNSKRLLVEGADDLFVVVGIMEHHVQWPRQKEMAPVLIEFVGSVDGILDPIYLSTKLKESGLEILGVMIDADDQPEFRWQRFRDLCKHTISTLPEQMPPEGLIVDCLSGLRLGFWMMPDCSSSGMVETFLRHLVPEPEGALWTHATVSTDQARTHGARYRDVHTHKALVHTWLSWQDPPGERLGIALTKKIFDSQAPAARKFVNWFIQLYKLRRLDDA